MSHSFETYEFSRMVNVADIPSTGQGFAAKASLDECAAICTRFDLSAVKCFEISGIIKPHGKQRYQLEAKLVAEIVQTCVITLDPIETAIEQAFKLALTSQEASLQENTEEVDLFDPNEEDPPLLFNEDKIDYGECAVQYFSDCLEIYPRKSDASFERIAKPSEENHEEKRDNPFDILQKLKP